MNKKYATYLCCMIMFAFGMVLSILSVLLSEISKEYSLSMAQSGIFFSISFSGFLSFVICGGVLTEKIGKKRIVYLSLLGLAIAMTVFATSSSLIFEYVAIFFMGGFGGIIESIVMVIVADENNDNRGYYINLAQIFLCAGAAFGPILGGLTVSIGGGWRMSYYILAVVSFLFFILLRYTEIKEMSNMEKIDLRKLKASIWDKNFLLFVYVCCFIQGLKLGCGDGCLRFLKKNMSISIIKSAFIVGAFWISMTVGRIICGWLTNYFSIRNIIIVLAYFSAAVVFISGMLSDENLIWLVVTTTGLAFSSLYPFIISIGSGIKSNATAITVLVGSGGIGTIIVPYLMGIIGDYKGIHVAMMSPSVLMLALGLIFTFVKFQSQKISNG